jgi:hypothetical protein
MFSGFWSDGAMIQRRRPVPGQNFASPPWALPTNRTTARSAEVYGPTAVCHQADLRPRPVELCQDVVEAAGVKDAQAPFLQSRRVSGNDAIPGPAGQRTEPALK